MFIYKRQIYLRESDATGVLYFSEQLKLALEALESYFFSKGFTLKEMIEKRDFLIPIVHAEVDFTAPITVGDQVDIHLSVFQIGTSSFTTQAELFKEKEKVGMTKIIHVCVSKKTRTSIPIPESVLSHLKQL